MSGKTRATPGAETETTSDPVQEPVTPKTEDTSDDTLDSGDTEATEDAGNAPPAAAASALASPTKTASGLSRNEAAAIAEIGAQAARLGVTVDVASALREGISADALRARVLAEASARDEAAGVMVATPAASTKPKESPIVAAAKRAASQVIARH